ncbi:hypothetical protein DEA98_22545 [Brucella pseudogrignonensis]|nr:hypothetical protein [Brucella pseudogrignonensis]
MIRLVGAFLLTGDELAASAQFVARLENFNCRLYHRVFYQEGIMDWISAVNMALAISMAGFGLLCLVILWVQRD